MKNYLSIILSFLISGVMADHSMAQSNGVPENIPELKSEILYMDSLFWESYNACDLGKFKTFFTDDLEFFHDKGGLTTTLATFMKSVENGLCGNENWRLRREVVEGSVKVFPVPDYGAIISGEHLFYIVENSTEKLDGLATFVHVWQYKNGEWKMSRVLSYDHRPAPSTNIKEVVSLSDEVLIQYVGSYETMDKRAIIISMKEGHLKLTDGKFEVNIYPESEDLFFHKERDLQLKFIKDGEQKVTKLVVLEKGAVVEEAKRME